MAKHVNIATVRFQSEWARNKDGARQIVLAELAGNVAALKGYGLDLVVFSEGVEAVAQSMDQAEFLASPGPVMQVYREFARQERCHVAGSVKLREGAAVYNAVVYYGPDGDPIGVYRKVYPTIGELEQGIAPGPGAVVVDTAIGRIGTAICFDLNFEALRDEYRALKPDIMVFASMYHGGLAQAAWAHECRAFFACAWQYTDGGILDPYGRPLAVNDCYHTIARARVNLDRVMVHLDYNSERFPEIERKYGDEVRVDIPDNIGSALIYSETDRRSAMDVADEFGLELLDDYMGRARRAREEALRTERGILGDHGHATQERKNP
jgi:predicted amidohydrolase